MKEQSPSQAHKKDIGTGPFLITATILVCILLSAFGFTGYYFYGPCGINRVKDAGLALVDQFDVYQNAYNTAVNSPRYALADQIKVMEDVKRESRLLSVPECMEGARTAFVAATDFTIQALVAFGMEDDYLGDLYLNESASQLAEFRTQLEAVELCKPFCTTR